MRTWSRLILVVGAVLAAVHPGALWAVEFSSVHADESACLIDGRFVPFFDTEPGAPWGGYTRDPTPSPTAVDADSLDTAILELCGPWGSRLGGDQAVAATAGDGDAEERAFRARSGAEKRALRAFFAQRPDLTADLGRLLGAGPRGAVDTVTRLWSESNGFRHVFCGEPKRFRNDIGGLHFALRYRELSGHTLGLAASRTCYRWRSGPQEGKSKCGAFPGGVHTLPVCYRTPVDGALRVDRIKGYPLSLSGSEYLRLVTAMAGDLRRLRRQDSSVTACAARVGVDYPGADDSGADFWMFLVMPEDAVLTAYPLPSIEGHMAEERAWNRRHPDRQPRRTVQCKTGTAPR